MERCSVSGKEIISNPHWAFCNPEKQYKTCLKRIGKDILFALVDSVKPVVLEKFEGDLVRKVVEDSCLKNKPVYLIWNLDKVKGITYAYKQGIVDFLYNSSPPLKCVVFYNTIPEFLNTAESIQAIPPSSLKILFAKNYNHAMTIILETIVGNDTLTSFSESDEYEKLKTTFLAVTARIGWMNMLNQPIALPHPQHDFYPFFKALSFLQQDLVERDALFIQTKLKLESMHTEKKKTLMHKIHL